MASLNIDGVHTVSSGALTLNSGSTLTINGTLAGTFGSLVTSGTGSIANASITKTAITYGTGTVEFSYMQVGTTVSVAFQTSHNVTVAANTTGYMDMALSNIVATATPVNGIGWCKLSIGITDAVTLETIGFVGVAGTALRIHMRNADDAAIATGRLYGVMQYGTA